MEPTNQRWSDAEFFREREKVLALWPTGRQVDLAEAAAYLKTVPFQRNYALAVINAKKEGRTLVQPRGGVALVEGHIELLRCLQDRGGADLLPNTTDTYTRNLRFQDAQKGIEESRGAGRSMLNGFPLVNHGLAAARQVSEAVDRPIIVLSGTAFPNSPPRWAMPAVSRPFSGRGSPIRPPIPKTFPSRKGSSITSMWIA